MSDSLNDRPEAQDAHGDERATAAQDKTAWETPTMEDVSEQVMAQPYIRFT